MTSHLASLFGGHFSPQDARGLAVKLPVKVLGDAAHRGGNSLGRGPRGLVLSTLLPLWESPTVLSAGRVSGAREEQERFRGHPSLAQIFEFLLYRRYRTTIC